MTSATAIPRNNNLTLLLSSALSINYMIYVKFLQLVLSLSTLSMTSSIFRIRERAPVGRDLIRTPKFWGLGSSLKTMHMGLGKVSFMESNEDNMGGGGVGMLYLSSSSLSFESAMSGVISNGIINVVQFPPPSRIGRFHTEHSPRSRLSHHLLPLSCTHPSSSKTSP